MKKLYTLLIISTLFFISSVTVAQDYGATGASAQGESSSGGTVDTEMTSLELSGDASASTTITTESERDGDPDKPVIVAPVPNSETAGIEPDKIDVSVAGEESASGYIKIDDIKGESQDSAKGNVETEWKVEEGESATADFPVEREMKESGEKGGTEDINIGVGENTQAGDDHKDWIIIESMSSTIQRASLISDIQNSAGDGLRAIYLKVEGIEGESQDDTESARKPKEIVVVGSKVRGETVPHVRFGNGEGETAAGDSFFDIVFDADSFEDAQLHAVSVAQNDQNIEELSLTNEKIRMEYNSKLRLFGFIPVPMKQTVEIDTGASDEFGRVKVRMPWWHILGRKMVHEGDLQIAVDATLPETTEADVRPTEEVAFYYNKISATMLQTLSNMMKTGHDAE